MVGDVILFIVYAFNGKWVLRSRSYVLCMANDKVKKVSQPSKVTAHSERKFDIVYNLVSKRKTDSQILLIGITLTFVL
jgi:hypothetical protein